MATGSFGQLFQNVGWGFGKNQASKEKEQLDKQELIDIDNELASEIIDSSYVNYTYLGTDRGFSTQAQKINEYRTMSQHPEVDIAIDDIVCDMVAANDDENPVQIDTSDLDLSDSLKKTISEEFDNVLKLLDFNTTAYEKCRQFYVDGRIAYNVVIDKDRPKDGIKRLVMFDPRTIKRVKEIKRELDKESRVEKITEIDEYYIYDPAYSYDTAIAKRPVNDTRGASSPFGKATQAYGSSNFGVGTKQKLKFSMESVVMVHSGVLSAESNMILSHLEKAIKALNNLKMMEDALVVYRITKAPERRVFYIDVGTLPKASAEAYMQQAMNKYRTRMVYDTSSGSVVGTPHQIAMTEDYWLPRREGGRGTEIDTLQGGQNLGDIEDVLYFKKNLYRALNVPAGRMEQEATLVLGNQTEIPRDEWKFSKFISRLRRRFNCLFNEILKRQLILKGITNEDDWENIIEPKLKYIYASQTYQKEQEEANTFSSQLGAYDAARSLEGRIFSRDTLIKRIFKYTDDEQREEREKIQKEIKEGLYPDPNATDQVPNF